MAKLFAHPLVVCGMYILSMFTSFGNAYISEPVQPEPRIISTSVCTEELPSISYKLYEDFSTTEQEEDVIDIPEPEFALSEEEIDLISIVTMAEAEGECEEGKRLVIDTVLNRVEHSAFPNTIHDVVYQPNQFSSMWNGRSNRCRVLDDIRELVIEEANNRYNNEVVFFRTQHYSDYGTPVFQVEHHYFSKY